MMIGLATAPNPLGPYTVQNSEPIFSEETIGEVEDPYLWKDADGFHLLAKDQVGAISGHGGAGILAHSDDCLNWRLDEDPLAYTKDINWVDGSTDHLGNMERVSALHDENGRITHLFFAVWEGTPGFCNDSPDAHVWNMVIPLAD